MILEYTITAINILLDNNLVNLNLEKVQIPIDSFIVSILLSFFLSFLLGKLYKAKSHSISNPESLARIFPILGVATTIVITVVKSSLALSLGLVGALSIVRFRTPIKEPEELTYIFLCIGIGLATGADQYFAAIIGFLLTALLVYCSNLNTKNKQSSQCIRISIKSFSIKDLNKLIKLIADNSKRIDFHNITVSSSENIDDTNLIISIIPHKFSDIENIAKRITANFPNSSFTMIDSSIF